MLSTMQEIFILLENEKQVPLYRLNRWGKPARGALAKLKTLGWIEKTIHEKEIYYRVTSKGESYLDETLEVLKNKKDWDGKWRLVMFDIPETERSSRDKLRRNLNKMGMGILQASVWITPRDVKEKINKLCERLKIKQGQVKYFEVSGNNHLTDQIVSKAWNIPEVDLELERFIKNAQWILKKMGKGNGDQYNAKKLIYEYALILKKGPILPLNFIEKKEIRKKAHEIYLELRHYAIS